MKVIAPVGVAVAVGTQILVIIVHFALKVRLRLDDLSELKLTNQKDKIDQCVTTYITNPSTTVCDIRNMRLSVAEVDIRLMVRPV